MIEDQLPFGYRVPFPNNPISRRLVSIHGTFPAPEDASYEKFDSFVWYLMDLEKDRPGDPLTLVIDSQGGDIEALEILLGHIRLISSPVDMVARNVSSAAALLFVSGEKGHRYVFEYSHILFHPAHNDLCPHCAEEAEKPDCEKAPAPTASDKGLDKLNWDIAGFLDKWTDGKILNLHGDWSDVPDGEERTKKILSLLKENVFLDAQGAITYGVADHIIDKEKLRSLFFR